MAGQYVSSGMARGTRVTLIGPQPPRWTLHDEVRVALPAEPDAVFDADGARVPDGDA